MEQEIADIYQMLNPEHQEQLLDIAKKMAHVERINKQVEELAK